VRLQLIKQAVHRSQQSKYKKIEGHVPTIFNCPSAVLVKVNAKYFCQSSYRDAHRHEAEKQPSMYIPVG
jgi:hypothetical protein